MLNQTNYLLKTIFVHIVLNLFPLVATLGTVMALIYLPVK